MILEQNLLPAAANIFLHLFCLLSCLRRKLCVGIANPDNTVLQTALHQTACFRFVFCPSSGPCAACRPRSLGFLRPLRPIPQELHPWPMTWAPPPALSPASFRTKIWTSPTDFLFASTSRGLWKGQAVVPAGKTRKSSLFMQSIGLSLNQFGSNRLKDLQL